jgi:4-aminobutyrate aminotransferase-like enzyme
LRFCPPLCITAEQVDTALALLGDVLVSVRSAACGLASPAH